MTAGHISCAATEGVVRPVLHELLPFGEEVTTPIRSLHLVAHRMGQCHFRDLIRVVGLLCAPVTERRAEPMGHSLQLQATEYRCERHVRQLATQFGVTAVRAREYIRLTRGASRCECECFHFLQECNGRIRQRHPMGFASLHTFSGDRPYPRSQIDFLPGGTANFSGAGCRQDQE